MPAPKPEGELRIAPPLQLANSGDDPRQETKKLARAAREARILSQIETCKALEKHAFRLAELAREADLSFLVYLFDMARVAAVDERSRLTRL
ncbi:hypothetical protein [Terrarubrum flagellatum]|uniref:hypothetical protein n=1 Tax=Terrirubrum flagellatum TaxID=2895980 RepID=UPI00314569A2